MNPYKKQFYQPVNVFSLITRPYLDAFMLYDTMVLGCLSVRPIFNVQTCMKRPQMNTVSGPSGAGYGSLCRALGMVQPSPPLPNFRQGKTLHVHSCNFHQQIRRKENCGDDGYELNHMVGMTWPRYCSNVVTITFCIPLQFIFNICHWRVVLLDVSKQSCRLTCHWCMMTQHINLISIFSLQTFSTYTMKKYIYL